MTTDEIDPMVPTMPRDLRTDGGRPLRRTVRRRAKTYDDPEDGAPLVPDLG